MRGTAVIGLMNLIMCGFMAIDGLSNGGGRAGAYMACGGAYCGTNRGWAGGCGGIGAPYIGPYAACGMNAPYPV